MKALAVLGTSSNAGKSWLVTALGTWLRRQGIKVVPFKAQNMSNNSYVTLEGKEIGRAQAVQAISCGLQPTAEMNPVLLKPSGNGISQLIVLGEPQQHIAAADYYRHIESLWQIVCDTLDSWKSRCDILLLEGAGSPVELNLMHRDIVNLRPIEYLNGRWLLVGDIERGGIFAQAVGTYNLMPSTSKQQGLGLVVNKFRGDLKLFADAEKFFQQHLPHLPYLGVLPYQNHLQPESEDSLCREAEEKGEGAKIAWIRFPYLSNSQDSQPWQLDRGVKISWIKSPDELADARIIILPGSKNTMYDLAWLNETGLASAICKAHAQGVPVVGICGGYQMLGRVLCDPQGLAGDAIQEKEGLGLLPLMTYFVAKKEVRQVEVNWGEDIWNAYEIHMGRSEIIDEVQPLVSIQTDQGTCWEGIKRERVWGTYLHGLFESTLVRQTLIELAEIKEYYPAQISWQAHQEKLYNQMADLLEEYLNLDPIYHYLNEVNY